MQKNKLILPALFVWMSLSILYVLARVISLQYAHYTGVEKFCSVVLLMTEVYVTIHTLAFLIDLIQSYKTSRHRTNLKQVAMKLLHSEPSVAILIPARHEPKEVLQQTILMIQNIAYKNKKIYILDDSSDERYQNEAKDIAYHFNIQLYRREARHGAKAGIINDCIKTLSEKYIVIFDSDQCPFPEFLHQLVSLIESDDKLAIVQSPQFYINVDATPISRAAAHQQCVFYEYICEGKSSQDAMFCCGTNFILRKKAIDDIGGFDETVVTEDFATSLKLHQHGWKSLYFDHALAFGLGPENLESYFKQQFRWTHGMITVFKRLAKEFIFRPLSLSCHQWWEYFISSSYFFTGCAFFIFNIFPLLFIFFNTVSFFATPEIYLLSYLPYILFSMTIFYSMLQMRRYQIKNLVTGQLLIHIAFPIQIKAALFALLGIHAEFGITSKERGATLSYLKLWPQILLMVVNFIACIWAINLYTFDRDGALIINAFWALYHSLILSSIFYFNQPIAKSELV